MTPPKNNSVKIIILIAVLCALFFLGNVFQYLSKNNVVKKYTSQISDISIQKASIEQDFNSSQEKITELSDNNRILDSKLSFYKDTIKLLKSRISNILNRDRITPAEKAAAKNLIDKLNSTIAE
ncbi:MAG: hypothetical protein ORN85_00535, partial [Sediminibacterium sp.]|nr:hypothetical protein [Sediminibacterium sp.]